MKIEMTLAIIFIASSLISLILFLMTLNFLTKILAPNDKTVPGRIIAARRDNSYPYVANKIVSGHFLSQLSGTIFPI